MKIKIRSGFNYCQVAYYVNYTNIYVNNCYIRYINKDLNTELFSNDDGKVDTLYFCFKNFKTVNSLILYQMFLTLLICGDTNILRSLLTN